MKPVALGQSALQVTPICLGTMTFGEQVDEATAHLILDRAVERGVDFLDAAEMYSVPARAETCGSTETIIGNWFAQRPGQRQKLVLATKVAGPSRGMPWIRGDNAGLSKAEIVKACEGSLRRLQTEVIDLYQIHWPDPVVPIEETAEAMNELYKRGKIRAIGVSNYSVEQAAEMPVTLVQSRTRQEYRREVVRGFVMRGLINAVLRAGGDATSLTPELEASYA